MKPTYQEIEDKLAQATNELAVLQSLQRAWEDTQLTTAREVAQVAKERDAAKRERDSLHDLCRKLSEGLSKYGEHRSRCQFLARERGDSHWPKSRWPACDCGYRALLERAKALTK